MGNPIFEIDWRGMKFIHVAIAFLLLAETGVLIGLAGLYQQEPTLLRLAGGLIGAVTVAAVIGVLCVSAWSSGENP